jgi:hypothetical protein
MSAVGTLAGLALRYTFSESADHSRPPRALVKANGRARQAVGPAVAGIFLLDRVNDLLCGCDATSSIASAP